MWRKTKTWFDIWGGLVCFALLIVAVVGTMAYAIITDKPTPGKVIKTSNNTYSIIENDDNIADLLASTCQKDGRLVAEVTKTADGEFTVVCR